MTATTRRTTWHDEPALRVIGGDGLEAVVVAGRGGKITSLRDGTGREWLAGPGPALPPPARGASVFVDAEMCGWDECVPTVDADDLDGVPLPDHGEAWTAAWEPRDGTWGYDGTALPYRFSRRVRPTSTGLELEYTAEALGTTPIGFQWAAHPQLVAGPGARILLPTQVHHVDGIFGVDGRQPWTDELAEADRVPAGGACKMWVAPETPADWAAVRTSTGAELRLSWDPVAVPYLALWVDAGMFSREPVIAVEPSTGSREALSRSLADGRCQVLEPGTPVSWSLRISASS